ncbi:peptidase C14 caspase catalytic subunit p20 [Gloeothece citriformis PCC 7424]|uniref:Peptidase C14 caspase catalytic subunit p20 n=1 Tax=Gloeothece citriformis (strain PCC 7424) TaxID=65393 RepID=B7KFF9_GLOC7|nr:caspase family protein [Gloeothece citriformis]ACK71875.1 peptidase C14 caspase catalytic subunit p20 [Gloeothece citriformis PCC 7424]
MFLLKLLYRVYIVMGLGLIAFGVSACKPTTEATPIPVRSPVSISNNPQFIAQKQSKIALVIGNANYEEEALSNPVNDATDIANALKELGFEVTLVTNKDLPTMEEAIDNFSRQLQGGVGVFYYAGHGVQVEGENYLVPLKAKLEREKDVKYEAYPLGKVLDRMEEAENGVNGVNIVIIDACRDNPFYRRWRSNSRSSTISRGLTAVYPPSGIIIAYATRQGDVASDGKTGQRNSPFTSALLQHIKTPNVDVQVMFRRVNTLVRQKTDNQQEPWTEGNLFGDEFYLNPQLVATSPQPSPIPVITIPTPKPSPSPPIAIIPIPPPSTPSNQPRSTLISSTTGVDYTPLRELLLQKKWREADQKTWDLMETANNRQQQGVLDGRSINKFSCEDLRMIDREWLNASGGKFGFSVQLAIYKQTGNTPGSFNEEAYRRFEDRVGWREKSYKDLTWGTNAPSIAPQGHLPMGGGESLGLFRYVKSSSFSLRLVNCNI